MWNAHNHLRVKFQKFFYCKERRIGLNFAEEECLELMGPKHKKWQIQHILDLMVGQSSNRSNLFCSTL